MLVNVQIGFDVNAFWSGQVFHHHTWTDRAATAGRQLLLSGVARRHVHDRI